MNRRVYFVTGLKIETVLYEQILSEKPRGDAGV